MCMVKRHITLVPVIVFLLLLGGAVVVRQNMKGADEPVIPEAAKEIVSDIVEKMQVETASTYTRTQFSHTSPIYTFSAEIPNEWNIEWVSELESINIYDSSAEGDSAREQSQIFIRHFNAQDFLTLSTVTIVSQEETEVHGHEAVAYTIVKKEGIADFADQPLWRNQEHSLVDIRYTKSNPSEFYVFSYNPSLDKKVFNAFIESIAFHNNAASIHEPMERSGERITKKPFGIHITPENSPVPNDRFTGYHSGTDFEVFESEIDSNVEVTAICGGELLQKRTVSGYGGMVLQECLFEDQPVTVVYGHMRVSSVSASVGSYISPGDVIGFLGTGESAETDGERKHLHLGIHKGTQSDIRGYVSIESALDDWLSLEQYF